MTSSYIYILNNDATGFVSTKNDMLFFNPSHDGKPCFDPNNDWSL
jgi:hypothetical protein